MTLKVTRLMTGFAAAAMCLAVGLMQTPISAQAPAQGKAEKGKGINRPRDPRAQQRKYRFTDTNEDLPYALYVSSKVTRDKKAPLIIALHGLGGDQNSLMRGNAIDLAEENGYILVGPIGYNPRGWYGTPAGNLKGKGKGQPTNDPANLRELSEKDVMNVLDLVRKEFNGTKSAPSSWGIRWVARARFTWARSMRQTGLPSRRSLPRHSPCRRTRP